MDTDKPVTTEDKAADAEKSSEESVTMSSDKMLVIKNAWKNTPDKAFPATLNLDECPPLRGYTGTYLDFHVVVVFVWLISIVYKSIMAFPLKFFGHILNHFNYH